MTTKKSDIMGLIAARKEDADCLTFTYGSESRLGGAGVATDVTMGGEFNLKVDEPKEMPGGTNAGPNPLDLFCASLGTCQEITYKLYATVMDIPLESVSADVVGNINLSGFVGVGDKVGMSNVDVTIKLDAPNASDEQLNTLKGAVDAHCPLVASISNPLSLSTEIVKKEPSSDPSSADDNMKDGVLAVVQAAKEDSNALQMTYKSNSCLSGQGLRTEVSLPGGHNLTVDEPVTMPGGTNAGPNPLDLFCASFGTCQEITYKYYAKVMDIPVSAVSCKVEAPIDLGGLVGLADDAVGLKSMKGTVTIESSASLEQLEQLKAAVDAHCPLVDTLKSATPVNLTWARGNGADGNSASKK